MKKKSIWFYAGLAWIGITLIGAGLAHYGLVRMYGGWTKEVNPNQFQVPDQPLVLANINVLSPSGEAFLPSRYVLIEDGKIISVDTAMMLDTDDGLVIDGSGKYLIPGLTDAHVHLFKSPNDLLLYLANGVTQVRELIGEKDHLQWKKEIELGRLGPDMYVSSPRLGSFGTMQGWFMEWSQGFHTINTAEEATEAVHQYVEDGYDGIKIYSQLNKESYLAICEAAAKINMPVMGHVPFDVGLEDVYTSSQSEIAHFEEVMNALNREFGYYRDYNGEEFLHFVDSSMQQVIDQLKRNDIYVTSTLWGTMQVVRQQFDLNELLQEVELAYVNPGLAEWSTLVPRGGLGWLPEVNRYQLPEGLTSEQQAGRKRHWEYYEKAEFLVAQRLIQGDVQIMVGTDASLPVIVPGFSLHDELEILIEAGMSPSQALRAATKVPADWMGTNTGIIAEGRKANLVLLNANPLESITNTRKIEAVIKNGNYLDRDVLDEMLLQVKLANEESRTEDIRAFTDK